MDDSLEQPSSLMTPINLTELLNEDDENSSGDEDGGLDWTKLPSAAGRPVIPKRGEKDFEPTAGGGSELQLHVLDRARSAMFGALKTTRNTSSKSISFAVWCPSIARAYVTVARGVHFASMGHSAPRHEVKGNSTTKMYKRLELLPEEALYLVERGTLFCTKESNALGSDAQGMLATEGAPMSVQQAYADMIGLEDLSLEKYQVFAYLKRLGFSITRTNPPTSFYPTALPLPTHKPTPSLLQRICSMFLSWTLRISRILRATFDLWNPFQFSGCLYHGNNYLVVSSGISTRNPILMSSTASIFTYLRFLSSGHSIPLQRPKLSQIESSPYKIFFNVYKPSTPFRKTAPGPPDFSIVVVNARTTLIPSLYELTALFDVLPELPLPPPRQRRPPLGKSNSGDPEIAPPAPARTQERSLLYRLFLWAFSPNATLARKPNPFVALKACKKNVVIAAVDAGSISFFRFGQGAFEEWPMA